MIGLLDWLECGPAYAKSMVSHAVTLRALAEHGLPVFTTALGPTTSHQFAVDAGGWGGGQAAAQRLREANILTCAIELPDRSAMGRLAVRHTRGRPLGNVRHRHDHHRRAGGPRAKRQFSRRRAKSTTLRRRYDTVGFTRQ